MEHTIFYSTPNAHPHASCSVAYIMKGIVRMADLEIFEQWEEGTEVDTKRFSGFDINELVHRGSSPSPKTLSRGGWLGFFRERTPKTWEVFGGFLEDYTGGVKTDLRVPENYEEILKKVTAKRKERGLGRCVKASLSEKNVENLVDFFETITHYYETSRVNLSDRFSISMDHLRRIFNKELFPNPEYLQERDFIGVLKRDYFETFRLFGGPIVRYVRDGALPTDQEMKEFREKKKIFQALIDNMMTPKEIAGIKEELSPFIQELKKGGANSLACQKSDYQKLLERIEEEEGFLPSATFMRDEHWDKKFIEFDLGLWSKATKLRHYMGFRVDGYEYMPSKKKDAKKPINNGQDKEGLLHKLWKKHDEPNDFGGHRIMDGLVERGSIDFDNAFSFRAGEKGALTRGEACALAQELCQQVRRKCGPESPEFKPVNSLLQSFQCN